MSQPSDINNPEELARCMASLYEDECSADVLFGVENRLFKAHRNILAIHSPVFRAMLLDGHFKESDSSQIIKLANKSSVTFEQFLKYLYTCRVDMTKPLDLNALVELFEIAHEYQVQSLFDSLATTLKSLINLENVLTIFETCLILGPEWLLKDVREFAFENAAKLVRHETFRSLSRSALMDLISNDLFDAPEIDILQAVAAWFTANNEISIPDFKPVLDCVRFAHVSLDGLNFAQVAPLYKMLCDCNINLEAIGHQVPYDPSRTIHSATPTSNVALYSLGATVNGVAAGENVLLDRGGASNSVTNGTVVIVKLPKSYLISSIEFEIPYNNGYGVATYEVHGSSDNVAWFELAKSQRQTSKRQLIIFAPRVLQYLKISGSSIYSGYPFAIAKFQCPAKVTEQDDRRYQRNKTSGSGEAVVLSDDGYQTNYGY